MKMDMKKVLYREVEKLNKRYAQVLYNNDVILSPHITMKTLGPGLAHQVEDATEISQRLYGAVIVRIKEIKSLAKDLEMYGAGTKFQFLTEVLNGASNIANIMQGTYAEAVDTMVSLHSRYIDTSTESGSDKMLFYCGQFNLESKEDAMDMHDLMTQISLNYEMTNTIARLITLTMAITLDNKIAHSKRTFDTEKVSYKYSQLYGLKRPPIITKDESEAYRILIQVGRWTLFNIMQHDFRDVTNWPFVDNLPKLTYEKTSGYELTESKMHKLKMIGAKEFRGMTLKECVYMSTLRELCETLL